MVAATPAESPAEARLDRIFHALADGTRRRLLTAIAEKECRVTDLAAPFDVSLNAISKHLKVLEGAGLLRRTRDGRVHRCRMDPAPLDEVGRVVAFYRKFWTDQMDALGRAIEDQRGDPS